MTNSSYINYANLTNSSSISPSQSTHENNGDWRNYLLVGAHNAAHVRGASYPGNHKYWKHITNQHLTVNEMVDAGVTIFDLDLYPIDLGIYSSLKLISNIFVRLFVTCLLGTLLSFVEYPDIGRINNDALLSHSVPVLGWTYLTDLLDDLPTNLEESIVLSLNQGGGPYGRDSSWDGNFNNVIDNIFKIRPHIKEINSYEEFDLYSKEVYFIRNLSEIKPGFQKGAIFINENGDGLIGQLAGDPEKNKFNNENIQLIEQTVDLMRTKNLTVISVFGDFLERDQIAKLKMIKSTFNSD